jgi:hypothetical protein
MHERRPFEDTEAMRKSARHGQDPRLARVKLDAFESPVCRRALAKIDNDIKDLAIQAADMLFMVMRRQLKVHAADHSREASCYEDLVNFTGDSAGPKIDRAEELPKAPPCILLGEHRQQSEVRARRF